MGFCVSNKLRAVFFSWFRNKNLNQQQQQKSTMCFPLICNCGIMKFDCYGNVVRFKMSILFVSACRNTNDLLELFIWALNSRFLKQNHSIRRNFVESKCRRSHMAWHILTLIGPNTCRGRTCKPIWFSWHSTKHNLTFIQFPSRNNNRKQIFNFRLENGFGCKNRSLICVGKMCTKC